MTATEGFDHDKPLAGNTCWNCQRRPAELFYWLWQRGWRRRYPICGPCERDIGLDIETSAAQAELHEAMYG